MKRTAALFLVFLIGVTLTFTASWAADEEISELSEDASLEELLRAGEQAAAKARNEKRTEEQLRKSIRIFERVVELDPDNTRALEMLSLGYFTLAEAYLEESRQKSAYEKGYEFGLRGLRAHEDFEEIYREIGYPALKKLPDSVKDVEALFWTGANLGRLAERKGVPEALNDNDLPALVTLNRRVLELEETYLGGGAHRNLGTIGAEVLDKLPLTFWQVRSNGFSWEKSKKHFEKAIEIAPGCLENYQVYARYYALNRGKEEKALELLDEVLERPLGDKYPLVNEIAKRKAESLKEKILDG
ncbi:MAG: TRAP transporter TatT component family protein [Candidatus Acetothermia bacterium]